MATKIEYLIETWNFMGGCSACSLGCLYCWACSLTAGRLKNHLLYKGLTKDGKWTGEIRLCTDIGRGDLLEKPLHWREPRIIGVQFMGDLFHESVPFEFIDKVFGVMFANPWHTYLLLTKRAKRMAQYIRRNVVCRLRDQEYIHLGVSISTQAEADEKIPILLQIPAAVRFVSLEPLLEAIDLHLTHTLKDILWRKAHGGSYQREFLHQVIIGAESIGGRPGRECKLEWVRDLVAKCKAAGVPVFVKQIHLNGKLVKDITKFPKDVRVRDYPKGAAK